MNECIFGLAEDMDLWPPEGGGVLSADGTHTEQNGHEPKLSTTSVYSMQSHDADMKPAAHYSSQECLSITIPPALPPRSPMAGRRTEKLKESDSDVDTRARARSLSFRGRKGKKEDVKKQESMPDPPPEDDCATLNSHYEMVDNEELRGWAKLWRRSEPCFAAVCLMVNVRIEDCSHLLPPSSGFSSFGSFIPSFSSVLPPSSGFSSFGSFMPLFSSILPPSRGSFSPSAGRPNSAVCPLKSDAFDRLLPFTVKPNIYGSDSSIPSSVKYEMETCPDSHYVITTAGSPPNGTSEEPRTGSPPKDIPLEEDPYSDPIDALASYNPEYLLYRRTPNAYPVLVRAGDLPQQLGPLRKTRRHSSVDNIFAAVEAEGPSEGVYSVPFEALLHRPGADPVPTGDRRVLVVGAKERPCRTMTDKGMGQLWRGRTGQGRSALPIRSQSWKGRPESKYRPRSQQLVGLEAEALRGAVAKRAHLGCNLKQFTRCSPDVAHTCASAVDTHPDGGPLPAAPEDEHDYCEIDLLPEKESGEARAYTLSFSHHTYHLTCHAHLMHQSD